MAYSELPWRPFLGLGHQAWSWTTLRRGNVFKRFFNFCHVFYVFNVFKFLFERFFHLCFQQWFRHGTGFFSNFAFTFYSFDTGTGTWHRPYVNCTQVQAYCFDRRHFCLFVGIAEHSSGCNFTKSRERSAAWAENRVILNVERLRLGWG